MVIPHTDPPDCTRAAPLHADPIRNHTFFFFSARHIVTTPVHVSSQTGRQALERGKSTGVRRARGAK